MAGVRNRSEQFDRELVEVIDHQLGFEQLRGGITVGDRNGSQARALCRDEAPVRVFDGNAFARKERMRSRVALRSSTASL